VLASVVSRQPYNITNEAFHRDHEFRDDGIQLHVKLYWHNLFGEPTLNLLKQWLAAPPQDRPQVVILGAVLWHLVQEDPGGSTLRAYEAALQQAVKYFNELRNTTKVIWMLQARKDQGRHKETLHDLIYAYDAVAERLLANSHAYVWSAASHVSKHYINKSSDGVHLLGTRALPISAQMVLNLYCNQFIVDAAAADTVCCRSPNL
jgi:hypothetical protein